MQPVRSTSGAVVLQLGDHVVKLGDTGPVGVRVGEQARWLEHHRDISSLIDVTPLTDTAYAMPACNDLPRPLDASWAFDLLVHALRPVWDRPPNHPGQESPFLDKLQNTYYLHRVIMPRDLYEVAIELYTEVDWDRVPRCLTHGDPTFTNLMMCGEQPVLLDPLPSSPTVPDVRAKDIGKIIQSLHEYEGTVLGWDYDTAPHPSWARELCEDDNEWLASLFCFTLHLIRLIPYSGNGEYWAGVARRLRS